MEARADSPTGVQEHAGKGQRGWHTDTKSPYCLPNDTIEHERLFSQSNGVSALFKGRMSHAPLSLSLSSPPAKMLDIGCGTGSVSLYLGDTYPAARVYGVDLSKVPEVSQQQAATKQRNVKFVQANYMEAAIGSPAGPSDDEAKELWQPNSYDLVFGRALVLGIENWDLYFEKAFALLKPGGWVEDQDVDHSMLTYPDRKRLEDMPECEWLRQMRSHLEATGVDIEAGSHAADRMRKAGFVDVRVEQYIWPFVKIEELPETWPMAEHCQRTHKEIITTAAQRLFEGRGVPQKKIDEYKAQINRDLFKYPGTHYPFYVTLGRKPEN